jgi:nudix-type nucleoside diphosphatase (YffH/AdpP family)
VALCDRLAAPADLEFYACVMGLQPQPEPDGPLVDLGPGGAEAEALAGLILACRGTLSAGAVRQRLASLQVQAASQVRATVAAPRGLRQGSGEVTLDTRRPAYAGFFALEVMDLKHRRFDGTMSAPLRREVFVAADAVTVLPYDPQRDRVLLVEQFRPGPALRGDPLPWQLEAIAGRIDPGETPEEAARREAVEEAGLRLDALEWVAGYYPSPGAMTEYIYSFVAPCDLPDGAAGVFGAEAEGEDIRGHLVALDRAVAAVIGGEITNAPLILTLLWLQRERPRLQATGLP